jgi:hypothetical protein
MSASTRRPARLLACVCAAAVALLVAAPAAVARDDHAPALNFKACGDAPNVQCAVLRAPLDYDRPKHGNIDLFVARSPATDPAHRIGALFLNFGGPGASIADFIEAFGSDGSRR